MNGFAPWSEALSTTEYRLTYYFLVIAALALFAGFLRSLTTKSEVGSRFRPGVVARLSITGVATASYILLLIAFASSYAFDGSAYQPNDGASELWGLRYADWSITVPLLTFELLAVCTVTGASLRRTQLLAGGSAFLMIFFGLLGGFIIDEGRNQSALLLWGGVSVVFWIITNVILIRAVRASAPQVTPEAASLLKYAALLLLSAWVVYPVVFCIQIFGNGSGWATAMQVALCSADIVAKLGFGTLIHRVAKLRTAEDVRAGDDVHPESIWISSIKQSDAGQPLEVHLARGAEVHKRQAKPPMSTAVAASDGIIFDDGASSFDDAETTYNAPSYDQPGADQPRYDPTNPYDDDGRHDDL